MLRNAVQRIAAAIPAQPKLMGEVQTDLGDWYMTGGVETRALPMYQEAWNSLVQVQAQEQLAVPVPLTYHPPPMATSRGLQDPDEFLEQQVELQLTVDASGRVREARVLNPAPERESAEKNVITAVRRTAFRPAVKDGLAVSVSDYVFRERVYVKRPKSKD
jgi:TonB family protein